MSDNRWLDETYWDGQAIALPEFGVKVIADAEGHATFPIETQAVEHVAAMPPKYVRQQLALDIRNEARKRGATRIYVSEPSTRDIPQLLGFEPSRFDHQTYAYVAYVTV